MGNNQFKLSYYKIKFLFDLVYKDIRKPFPVPLSIKLKMWMNGFLAEKHVLYDLPNNKKNDFLSDYNSSLSRFINGEFCEILNNKYIFDKIVSSHIRTPKTYLILLKGNLYSLNESFSSVSYDKFGALLEAHTNLVVKPISGGGGRGVLLLSHATDGLRLNGEKIDARKLQELLCRLDYCLVSEFIEQSEFSNNLYPGSINSIRALTLRDPSNGEMFMPIAVQRIGNRKSAPQDNFSKGGLSARIDLESGRLSAAVTHPKDRTLIWHKKHPDTGEPIEGVAIPDWNGVRQTILAAAQQLPFLHLIGWDILIAKNGVVAIEANNHPDPDVLQGHIPLLQDPRVKHFYQHHKIIR